SNLKVNEFLYRRVDTEDVVSAHLLAMERAATLGFEKFIITSTTPFGRDDLAELGTDAPAVLARRVPAYREVYAARGWRMLPVLDRVYVNEKARRLLGWQPKYDFARALSRVAAGEEWRSPLAVAVGS